MNMLVQCQTLYTGPLFGEAGEPDPPPFPDEPDPEIEPPLERPDENPAPGIERPDRPNPGVREPEIEYPAR